MRSELPDDFFKDCDKIENSNDLIIEIQDVDFYNPINFYKPNRVELVNDENGQLIIVNLDTKVYTISHINSRDQKSDSISFNLKNKNEYKLYYFAKQAFNDFYRVGDAKCCLIN